MSGRNVNASVLLGDRTDLYPKIVCKAVLQKTRAVRDLMIGLCMSKDITEQGYLELKDAIIEAIHTE